MEVVPRVPPFDRPATYDDLVKLPNDLVAEIVNGELHASARPSLRHAQAGSRLGQSLLPAFQHPSPDGWWLLYEPELHLGPDTVVPDWAGWRRERLPRVPDSPFCTVSPDWVCEILSPSTEAFDRARKLAVYAREAVRHAWLIDPIARTLEALTLESGRWVAAATHLGAETVRAEPFADVELSLAALWAEE